MVENQEVYLSVDVDVDMSVDSLAIYSVSDMSKRTTVICQKQLDYLLYICTTIHLLSYCTSMHEHFVHCEIFDVNHWNITQRCNKITLAWFPVYPTPLSQLLRMRVMATPYIFYFTKKY